MRPRRSGGPDAVRGGLFAWLRGADGRSLAHALAALLFLNALVAGMHAGFAAAPGASATVLCHSAPDGSPPAPSADHEHDCCLTGAGAAAAPLPVVTQAEAIYPAAATIIPDAGHTPPLFRAATREGPRAPPALA